VRAGDVRAALERVLRNPDSPVRGFASSIVGAEACIARPRSCSLARGVVTNDEAGTVAFHLVRPDPELLQKLALPFAFPVPKGTPLDLGGRSVPATGPYMLAERTPTRLRLVRNPRFNVRSGAAQPDGVPDEIVWRFDPKAERRVEAVLSGRADFAGAVGSAPERLLDDLRTRFASQLHVDPVRATFYVALNTRRSPFDDPDVRRALNFAVDREELVRLFGGPDGARSTCQVLPPGLPGYVPYCPYTLRPASGGTWSGPDLAEARRLVARSGTRGTRITLSYTPRIPGASAGPYVASVLRALGYEVQLRRIADEGAYFSVLEAGAYGHAAPSGWFADYPSPSAFVAPQLGCSQDANATGFCSRRIDRQMRRALALQERDAQAAGAMWARIDRSVTDEAPWLSMVNLRLVNLVSERVGNYQSNPQWGVLVDQLWVR
jgi:peptide/nickel transport system substrate-binding protein